MPNLLDLIVQRPVPELLRSSNRISVPWSPKDGLLGTIFVAFGILIVLTAISFLSDANRPMFNNQMITIVSIFIPAVMMIPVWLFGIRKHQATWQNIGFSRPKVLDLLFLPWPILLISLSFFTLYTIAISELGTELLMPPDIPNDILGAGVYKPLNITSIVFLGPISEEVFFRAFLMTALFRPLGTLGAILASSTVFAAGHGSLGFFIPAFVSGVLLSWLYIRSRSIWPPLAAHSAQNAIALGTIALSV